ncbi:MAG: hypothetical protein ACK4IY_01810 [Chitinophagales bacterium]
MNSKILIAGILTGIISFLLGWAIWGMLLKDYYDSNMIKYEGLEKENINMVAMIIAQLAGGILLAYIIGNFSGAINMQRGAIIGAIVGLLWCLSIDFIYLAMMNMFANNMVIVVDVIVNTIFSGILGAFIGWYMGRGAKA